MNYIAKIPNEVVYAVHRHLLGEFDYGNEKVALDLIIAVLLAWPHISLVGDADYNEVFILPVSQECNA